LPGEASALIAALLWAVSSILLTSQARRIDPLSMSALRALSAGLLLALLALTVGFDQLGDLRPGSALAMVGSGVLGMGLGDTLYITSLGLIGVSRAFPISMATYPLLTYLLAAAFLDEGLRWAVLLGAVLIVVGVSAVAMEGGGGANPGRTAPEGRRRGTALVLIAAVVWALATLWLRAGSEDIGAIAAGSLRMPAAGLFLLGLAFLRHRRLPTRGVSVRSVATVALAGTLGTGLGGLLYIAAVQEAGAGKAAILSSTSPLFVLPMAMLFLAERVSPRLLAGVLVSVVGIWLVV